tara:strand:+ start:434 stop:1162 length:729 start_codon:yes stop_codon:yes gene_type:complete
VVPLIKRIFIYDKVNKKFFIQKIRNKYDILTVYEIFSVESYNLKRFRIWKNISEQYKNYKDKKLTPLIIDCGSNIGSSAEYFQRIFKESFIVLIEPEYQNFNFSRKNLYNINNNILNLIISSLEKDYLFQNDFEDPRGSKVNQKTGVKTQSTTINKILDDYPQNNYKPFLIKIDIEGFESELFSKNLEWMDKFDIIIIEIHDWMLPKNSNSSNFINALSETMKKGNKRDLIISGENLISIKI